MLNSFCLTWAFCLLLFIVADGVFSDNVLKPFLVHLCCYLAIILAFIFQKKRMYTIARIIFMNAILFATFVFANYYEKGSLMENFYFIYPLLALIFFDDKRYTVFFLVVSFLLYYVPSNYIFIDNYPNKFLEIPELILAIFIGTYVILNYSQTLNRKSEKELDKKRKELEHAYKRLAMTKENELSSLKLQSLRSQMNPHFIFNALNSIQDYIINNNKTLAGDYLGKFADLIRLYLNQSSQREISLSEEIDTLQRYLELEKLRFEEKLEFTITVDTALDAKNVYIPTMLLQPYIENSLKHGLLHKNDLGTLMVDFKLNIKKKILICTIADDGIGREKSRILQHHKQRIRHQSFATRATQERLNLLNFGKEKRIEIQIEDLFKNSSKKDVGTKVTLKIPV